MLAPLSMMTFLVSITMALALAPQSAQAGGGGCGDECPPPRPAELQGSCEFDEVRAVDPSTFELDASVEKLFAKMKAGFTVALRGDKTDIYSAEVSYANEKPIEGWNTYHDKYPFDSYGPSMNATFTYRTRWSISDTDPRPLVEAFRLQILQEADSKFARVRLIAMGFFDQANKWKSSDRTVFIGAVRCKI